MSKPLSLLLALMLIASALLIAQSNVNDKKSPQNPQAPPAAQPIRPEGKVQPVTGKDGNSSRAINTSTTSSVGIETPGVQTDNGMAQQPDKYPYVHPVNPQPSPGAPPNWEQVGQEEQLANSNAAAAARAEYGGPEGTLGVGNSMPSYSRGAKPLASSATKVSPKKQPK